MTAYRILVTGSRNWADRARIETDLSLWRDLPAGDTAVLVSGACPTGADRMAEDIWESWGLPIERHPADWDRYGRGAGPRRNAQMVACGADICLAYIRDHSRGATYAADLAIAADIVTLRRTTEDR